jgi:hypothetical protein
VFAVLSRFRIPALMFALAASLRPSLAAPSPGAAARRVVIQASPTLSEAAVEDLAEGARARGVEVRVAAEGGEVESGFVLLRLSTLPPSARVRDAVLVFPIQVDDGGFVFDGRAYRRLDEAVRLTTSTRGEVIVLGNSPEAVLALGGSWLASPGTADYEVLSGEVSREGRFERREGRLFVDPATDRDHIARRDEFLKSLERRSRGAITWEFPGGPEAARTVEKWEKAASRFLGRSRAKVTIRVYPDAVTKAILTGSARPADLSGEARADGREVFLRVDLDASAPAEPDQVTPVLASAGVAAATPALLKRPLLLSAAGARRAGRWWGRDVKTFAAFTRAAAVDPSIVDVLASAESLSPVLDIGTVASWLDAGARLESEAAVEKALRQTDAALGPILARWRTGAERQPVKPPARRELPATFLRGVEYPAPEAIEDGWVSSRSREALGRLASAGYGSISLRPGALMRDPRSEEILFVRRGARGETDEGLVRAIGDAHGAGMTAAVSPELLVGGGVPAGEIAAAGEAAWAKWFAAYRRFLVHEAVVAEAGGVDLFVVGTGLTSSQEQKNEWKQVIAAVRLGTGAPLTYSAAAPAGVAEIPFWDGLDAIGSELADPLTRTEKTTDDALAEAVRAAIRPLGFLSKRMSGKPVVLTRAAYDEPRTIAAVFRALSGATWWRGVYWPSIPGATGSGAAERAVIEGFRSMEPGESAP